MSNPLKKQWRSLKRGQPGRRFKARYDAGRNARKDASWGFKVFRLARIIMALALVAVGIVLMFIPGPAVLFFLLAGSLLAAESLMIANVLDWAELRMRAAFSWLKRHWIKLHLAGKMAVTGLAATAAGGCAYAAYRIMVG